MNHNSSPILKNFHRLFLIAAVAVYSAAAVQTVKAQSVATATLTSGGLNSITIGQNGTFTLTLAMTTNFLSSGYTVFYQSNNGQGLFQLIGLTYLDPFFMPFGPIIDPFPGVTGVLNPSNMFDIGATGDQVNNQPAGTFDLQSVTVSVLNAPIGTYTIFLDNRSIMTEHNTPGSFNDVNFGGPSGPAFTVNVVPEPATVGLLIMGGAFGLVAALRRRRTAI